MSKIRFDDELLDELLEEKALNPKVKKKHTIRDLRGGRPTPERIREEYNDNDEYADD